MTEAVAKQEDPYFDLIREVTTSAEASAEKLKILVDMRILLEDRRAEKEFDAAMFAAQDDVQELAWDKVNREKGSRNVSYPKIDKMLKPVRRKHGFTMSWDTEPGQTLDMAILCCDVMHTGGHRRRYRTPMPIDGQGPKGGGVMTKSQAVNSGTSYGMRNLAKMIFNIPMLVDQEDKDGNDLADVVTKAQVVTLKKLAAETKTDINKLCEHFKVDSLGEMPKDKYEDAIKVFEKKRNRITEGQVADLQAIAEELKVDIAEFCKPFNVKVIANIPASRYAEAVQAMEALR